MVSGQYEPISMGMLSFLYSLAAAFAAGLLTGRALCRGKPDEKEEEG